MSRGGGDLLESVIRPNLIGIRRTVHMIIERYAIPLVMVCAKERTVAENFIDVDKAVGTLDLLV